MMMNDQDNKLSTHLLVELPTAASTTRAINPGPRTRGSNEATRTATSGTTMMDFATAAGGASEEVVPLTTTAAVAAQNYHPYNINNTNNAADPLITGFLWYQPPLQQTVMANTTTSTAATGAGADGPNSNNNRNHNKNNNLSSSAWQISGHDMQILTTTVPAGGTIVTEIGSFLFGSPGIQTSVELTCCTSTTAGHHEGGDGGNSSGSYCCCTWQGWDRVCGGESCVKVLLTNEGRHEGYVGLTPNFPAKIIPIQFGTHINAQNALIAQGGAYMSQIGNVDVACDADYGLRTCCCAGFGICRQKLTGTPDSIAFLAAGGTIVYKQLEPGETVTVDTRAVLAIEESIQLGIIPNGRLCTTGCWGGQGCFSSTLTGPGMIFMHSMSFPKFAAAVSQTVTMEDRGGDGDDQ